MRRRAAFVRWAGSVAAVLSVGALTPAAAYDCQLNEQWIRALQGTNETLGVAVRHVESGATVDFSGSVALPMQSVFKLPLAVYVLRLVDLGRLSLNRPERVSLRDLAPGRSPLADQVRQGGPQLTNVQTLLRGMVIDSDNTAADLLLRMAGGPLPVNRYLQERGVAGIDVSLSERQSAELYFGIPFRHDSPDPLGSFEDDLKHETPEHRRASAGAYSADLRNTATPFGIVDLLAKLQSRALLSAKSTTLLLDMMTQSPSFPGRLKGRLPPGTPVAHKTGTSAATDGITQATNDVGLITLPDGSHIAIAVLLKNSSRDDQARDATIAAIARQAYDCWAPPAAAKLLLNDPTGAN